MTSGARPRAEHPQTWRQWRRARGLHAHIRRRLFWRFYLTLLASLMVMVILGGFIWRTVADAPNPPGYDLEQRLTGALLPPPDAPKPAIAAAIADIAAGLDAHVTLLGADGSVLASAGWGGDWHEMMGAANDRHVPRGRSFRAWRVDLPDGRILIARGLKSLNDTPPPGFYYLFLVAIAIGVAAFPFVRRITLRLERLRLGVENWGEGHLSARIAEQGSDEIAAVARSFNVAAARVEALVAAHKTLLANASHELRSPLARLRMAVEVYRNAPSDEIRHAIAQDIGELDQLVDEILLSSRLDHDGPTFERESVDMLGLAAEEAARVDANLTAGADAEALTLAGSARLLRRLIRNLLENARRHGAPPIEIMLASLPSGSPGVPQMIVLTVTDHGKGVPEAERQRVFEPFYRPAGHAESGSSWGLGLSLVARIAASHGGRVRCEAGVDGGARFVVELGRMEVR